MPGRSWVPLRGNTASMGRAWEGCESFFDWVVIWVLLLKPPSLSPLLGVGLVVSLVLPLEGTP